jgi:Flp pilus assembly protein TadD
MAVVSWKQTTYWRNGVTVWQRDLAVADESYTGHKNLGAALWERGEQEESRKHSARAQVVRWATAVRDYPEDAKLRDNLGFALMRSGDAPGAVREWEQSVQVDSQDGNALNNLAWIFATHPDPSMRNGARAVDYAQRAVQLPGGNAAMLLRTLAAAQAEAGDFSNAVFTAERAIELANTAGNSSLVQTLRHEAALYAQQQPYRERPPSE